MKNIFHTQKDLLKAIRAKPHRSKKAHFVGYDCRSGTHNVYVGCGQYVKLCDKCFKEYKHGGSK